MTESVITQEMEDAIGVESKPITYSIEKNAIMRFAQAIGDTNPIFSNEEAARDTPYKGMVAPPTFLRSIAHVEDTNEPEKTIKSPYSANVDAGSEWEYFEPIHVGDTITSTTYLSKLEEKQGGKFGNMLIMTRETKYINQNTVIVAFQRTTGISYQP